MDKLSSAFLLAILCMSFSVPLVAQDKRPLKWGVDNEGGIPYYFHPKDKDKENIGFEVDLADAMQRHLRRPIEPTHQAFESMIPAVMRGDVDFAMNGIEITPQNRQNVRFTRPYYIYQLQLVARIDDGRFTTLKECKDLGLKVGVLDGSAAVKVVADIQIEPKLYGNQENLFDELRDKAADAVLVDVPIAVYYVMEDNQVEFRHKDYTGRFKFVGAPFAEGYYGIAVKRDDEALANELDAALGHIVESGELKRILTKWHLWSPDQYRLYTPIKLEQQSASSLNVFDCVVALLQGAVLTVFITIAGMALAVLIGLPIATARLYGPAPLRWLAGVYVEFFRGIPVLLLLYFLYYGLPELIGVKLDPLTAAILGFGMNYAAYEAEIYRAGIQAVPTGQWEAAASLGMSPLLTFRRIVFPQSIRAILPPMTNDFIALFKDTSVVSIISVVELSKQYQIQTKIHGSYLEIGMLTAALYLVMSVPLGYLSRHLEKRWGAK